MSARKRRVTDSARSFRRDWEQLLDDANLKSAEDRQAALREAEKLPQLRLHRLRGRPHLVLKIEVPLESEAWLHARFGTQPGADAQQQSLAVVQRWAARKHPLLQEIWNELAWRLETEFRIPRAMEPFRWLEADRVDELLALLFQLTSREWPEGTLVRDASTQLGHDSKFIESQQSFTERALELLFGRATSLEALGIQTNNSVLHYCGPLELHFSDHSKPLDLRFESTLSVAELDRATRITTTAERILTVENHKTTFRQLAHADSARTTLIVASSFPTQAVRRLLEKLPPDLPHHHFGDTDPAGWDILRCLREITARRVLPFHMSWRPCDKSRSLIKRDQQIIARLLADQRMADCHDALRLMRDSGVRGEFEQESLGAPDLQCWPFFAAARESGA